MGDDFLEHSYFACANDKWGHFAFVSFFCALPVASRFLQIDKERLNIAKLGRCDILGRMCSLIPEYGSDANL